MLKHQEFKDSLDTILTLFLQISAFFPSDMFDNVVVVIILDDLVVVLVVVALFNRNRWSL